MNSLPSNYMNYTRTVGNAALTVDDYLNYTLGFNTQNEDQNSRDFLVDYPSIERIRGPITPPPPPAIVAPQPAIVAPQPARTAPQPARTAPQPARTAPQPARTAPPQPGVEGRIRRIYTTNMFIGKTVNNTYSSDTVNLPRFEEGDVRTSNIGTNLKQVIKRSGVSQDTRRGVEYYPVYIDFGNSTTPPPSNYFTLLFNNLNVAITNDQNYKTAVARLGRLFVIDKSTDLPYYLSYVDASDPNGLPKIWNGFINTVDQYRGIFRIFNRTYAKENNKNNKYEIVTYKCFDSSNNGVCIDKRKDFMFVNMVDGINNRDGTTNIRGFNNIVPASEITTEIYDKLTIISGTNRNAYRFKPIAQLEVDRTTAIDSSQKVAIAQALGKEFITNHYLYETNLIVVDIKRSGEGRITGIKNNSKDDTTYFLVSDFDSNKVYYVNEIREVLNRGSSLSTFSNLYLRKKFESTFKYYKIISSNVADENNSAKSVWKIYNKANTEYLFVHLRKTESATNLVNNNVPPTNPYHAANVGKIGIYENDNTITIA